MKSNRIQYVDRLKGLAIILVVIGHIYLFTMNDGDNIVGNCVGSFHMCLFMFLSGFVASSGVTKPYWTQKKLWKKIAGLIIPMLVFGGLFTLTFGPIDSWHVFMERFFNFLMAPAKNGYWYLMSLSVFYLSLLLFRFNKWNSKIVEVLIAALSYGLIMIGWKFTAQKYDPFCLLNCGNFYLFFITGVFASKYGLLDKLKNYKWLVVPLFIVFLLLFNWTMPIHALNSAMKHILVPGCAVTSLLILFVNREGKNSKCETLLSWVGRNTLDVYVLHYFFVGTISLEVANRWLKTNCGEVVLCLVVIAMSFAITILTIEIGKLLHKSTIINIIAYGKK